MSAQSSSATRLSTTGAETNPSLDNTPHPSVKHCADKVYARHIHGRADSELVFLMVLIKDTGAPALVPAK